MVTVAGCVGMTSHRKRIPQLKIRQCRKLGKVTIDPTRSCYRGDQLRKGGCALIYSTPAKSELSAVLIIQVFLLTPLNHGHLDVLFKHAPITPFINGGQLHCTGLRHSYLFFIVY